MASNIFYKVWTWGEPTGQGANLQYNVGVRTKAKRSDNNEYEIANEMLCLRLAEALKLPVPSGGVLEYEGHRYFASLDYSLAGENLPPIDHWREELEEGEAALKDRLMKANGGNYNIVSGGTVDSTGQDSADVVCRFLFGMLVGGESGDDADDDDEPQPQKQFVNEMRAEFRRRGILSGEQGAGVRYPMGVGIPVQGERSAYNPKFVQYNHDIWVTEPINFATQSKRTARDHAGYIARMFDDIRKKHRDRAKTIGVVRGTDADFNDDFVKEVLPLLEESTEGRVVKWNHDSEREAYLEERERVARLSDGDARPWQ